MKDLKYLLINEVSRLLELTSPRDHQSEAA
jgi:hypothetical protein